MKFKKIFAFLLAAPLFLSSCIMNNGICYTHVDNNKDGICDVCGSHVKKESGGSSSGDSSGGGSSSSGDFQPCAVHTDHNLDGICDICGADISKGEHTHIDGDNDTHCDICGATMICTLHIDQDNDGFCDNCNALMPSVPTGGEVTIYLVLSSVGKIDGAYGATYPDFHLDYAYKLDTKVGEPLPGKDRITHAYGSADFTSWVAYEGNGAPTVYTVAPGEPNKILYAQFTPNGSAPEIPDTDPGEGVDTTTKEFTLTTTFGDQNWSKDNAVIAAYTWDDNGHSRTFKGTTTDRSSYKFNIYVSMKYLLFIRVSESTTLNPLDWSAVWTQTDDMTIGSATKAEITSWDGGSQGHSTAKWVS